MARTAIKGRGTPGKETANYTLFDDGNILVYGVRFSYPNLGRAFQGKPDPETGRVPNPRVKLTALMPKDTHDAAKRLIDMQIDKTLRDGKAIKDDARALKDGDREVKPEYKGMWFINLSEDPSRRPALRGINGERVTVEGVGERGIDEMFQGGYWGDVLFSLWQQKGHGDKVNGSLRAVRLARKDETFGQGGISDDDVDDIFGVKVDASGFDDEL